MSTNGRTDLTPNLRNLQSNVADNTARTLGRRWTFVLGGAVVLVWSTCFVTIKISASGLPPLTFAAARALLAAFALLAVTVVKGGGIMPPSGSWPLLALSALTGTSLAFWGMFGSVPIEGTAIPSILGNSQALIVAPLATIFLGERHSATRWLGLFAGFLGLSLVVAGASQNVGSIQGALLALGGSAGLAISSLVSKRLIGRMSALTLTTWQFLLGAIPLIIAAIVLEGMPRFEPTTVAVGGLFYLGVISSAGGSIVWNRLLRQSDVTALAALTMLAPPLSLILSLLFFKESISLLQWTGVGAVLFSVCWLEWRENRHAEVSIPTPAGIQN